MAIPLLPIALGAQLLGGVGQLFGGGRRRRAARAAQERMRRNLNALDTMAREGMPEAQYDQGLQNIRRNQASAIRMLQGLGGGSALRGISSIVSQSNDATLNLDVQDALQRQRNRMYAWQQRQALENQSFNQESRSAQALTGSGIQNIFGALSGAATASILAGNGGNADLGLGSLFNRRRVPLHMINSNLSTVGVSPIENNVQVQTSF